MWLGYLVFVVYGSLVPLDFQPHPLAQAWAAFQNIPFLDLNVDSRADWISNGVLYAPLAFLSGLLLTQAFSRAPRIAVLAVALAFCVGVAWAVEFAQLFFPPRTVSLNDVLAECLGSVVGVALVSRGGAWFQGLIEDFRRPSRTLMARLLDGYALFYLAFALFPYDVLLSAAELDAKIQSNSWAWLMADTGKGLGAVFQLGVEALLCMPLGLLLTRVVGVRRISYPWGLATGALLGGGIEIAQFFLASGVSQGVSVASRMLGICLGIALVKHRERLIGARLPVLLRRFVLPASVIYLLVLLALNKLLNSHWTGLDSALDKLQQINFIPFYYHYFTSEAKALISLSTVCLSYAPIGVLVWACRGSVPTAVILALSTSFCIESGKLFNTLARPDPSNLFLAGAAAALGLLFMRRISRAAGAEGAADAMGRPWREANLAPRVEDTGPTPSALPKLLTAACLMAAAGGALSFPTAPAFLCLVLGVGAFAAWRQPRLAFFMIPLALPVLDLAPWSGRFFIDEFDLLLLAVLALAYARVPRRPMAHAKGQGLLRLILAAVAISFGISMLRGLWPLKLPDDNAFNTYFSVYNAVRIGKGVAWAWLCLGLWRRLAAQGIDVRRPLAWGLAGGLSLTVAVVLWERVAFSGLWNMSDGYRVTGPFSAMHTGGAYIECFLACATPFVIMLVFEKRAWPLRWAGAGLLLATTYALMVTFSRGGYAAFAFSVFTMLAAIAFKSRAYIGRAMALLLLAVVMLGVSLPIFLSDYAQSRMATVNADLSTRKAHWAEALDMRDLDGLTWLFGMGLGRFPETSYWRSTSVPRSGTFQMEREGENRFLRLGAGDSLYMEQPVSLEPGQRYVLTLDVRTSRADARLTVPICEKWLLTSYNCIWLTSDLGKEVGRWRTVEIPFRADGLAVSPWYSSRPIKLALYYATPQSTIDVDNVRLEAMDGGNLIRNGDFSQNLDHWFFSTDGHLQWHVKSLFYGVLFDQGVLGVLALAGLFAFSLARSFQSARSGDLAAVASLAALGGFLIVGLADTLIDAPRFLLLMFLLAWACVQPRLPLANASAARPPPISHV